VKVAAGHRRAVAVGGGQGDILYRVQDRGGQLRRQAGQPAGDLGGRGEEDLRPAGRDCGHDLPGCALGVHRH
jgi:hypothetical protein